MKNRGWIRYRCKNSTCKHSGNYVPLFNQKNIVIHDDAESYCRDCRSTAQRVSLVDMVLVHLLAFLVCYLLLGLVNCAEIIAWILPIYLSSLAWRYWINKVRE